MNMPEREFDYPRFTDQWYIARYLEKGSVEAVYLNSLRAQESLPISVPHYHRLVKKYGIIKSSGRREVSLTDALSFFAQKALEPSIGLETLYQRMPSSFQVSIPSLHRIYSRIKDQTPYRFATGLVVHFQDSWDRILMANEYISHLSAGKRRGDLSIPMTFSSKDEPAQDSILRVLQQEVLTNAAINGKLHPNSDLARQLVVSDSVPFLHFDILDVRVQLFDICLPTDFDIRQISSLKVGNHRFVSVYDAIDNNLSDPQRLGVSEMLFNYYQQKSFVGDSVPSFVEASLNKVLQVA